MRGVVLDHGDQTIADRVDLLLIAVVERPELGGLVVGQLEVHGDQGLAIGPDGVDAGRPGWLAVPPGRRDAAARTAAGEQQDSSTATSKRRIVRHGLGSFRSATLARAAAYFEIFVIFEPWTPMPAISPF